MYLCTITATASTNEFHGTKILSSAPSRAFEMIMLGLVTQDDLDANPGLDVDQDHYDH